MLYIGVGERALLLWGQILLIWKHSLGSNGNGHQLHDLMAQGSAREMRNKSVHRGFDTYETGSWSALDTGDYVRCLRYEGNSMKAYSREDLLSEQLFMASQVSAY
jgi:hypothetical protein